MRTVLRTAVATATAVVVLALAASLIGLPSFFSNPFQDETVVRDHAAVLQSLEDLSEYRAATGSFQVVIDIEDRTRFVPGFLKGERTTFLAEGSVDALVDLDELGPESVVVAEDGSVTVRLPAARLADPEIDHDASGVLDRDRGLLDRVGGVFSDNPTSERELYLEAESRLAGAAANSKLLATAERNTETMLRQLLTAVGVADVDVIFEAGPAGQT